MYDQGRVGLASIDGKTFFEPCFDSVKCFTWYCIVVRDGKKGLANEKGKMIVPIVYQDLRINGNRVEVLTEKGWKELQGIRLQVKRF